MTDVYTHKEEEEDVFVPSVERGDNLGYFREWLTNVLLLEHRAHESKLLRALGCVVPTPNRTDIELFVRDYEPSVDNLVWALNIAEYSSMLRAPANLLNGIASNDRFWFDIYNLLKNLPRIVHVRLSSNFCYQSPLLTLETIIRTIRVKFCDTRKFAIELRRATDDDIWYSIIISLCAKHKVPLGQNSNEAAFWKDLDAVFASTPITDLLKVSKHPMFGSNSPVAGWVSPDTFGMHVRLRQYSHDLINFAHHCRNTYHAPGLAYDIEIVLSRHRIEPFDKITLDEHQRMIWKK